jgi:glutaredoxin-like YruB-family protein
VSLARWQILLILILTITSTAWAGSIYRWVDKDGVVHFSDHAPDNDAVKGDIETRQAVAGDPAPGTSAGTIGAPSKSIQTPPDDARHENAIVEIYTTSWCRYCKDTKRYFRSRGISFTEYDVEKDSAAARRLRRLNPRGGVPLTVINGRPIVGYAPAAFDRALRES